MGAPTLYRSDDTDAPQFVRDADYSVQFQNLMNVLKGCLVNGYGSKSAAGWTVPYEGTDDSGYETVVFKNSTTTGTGACIMFKRNGAYLEISAAKDITGLNRDSTTHIVPLTAYPLTTVGMDCKNAAPDKISFTFFSNITNGSTTNWCVIANERAFYLITQYDDGIPQPLQMLAFGDYKSDFPNPYQIFITSSNGSTYSTLTSFFGPTRTYYPSNDISETFYAYGHFMAQTVKTNAIKFAILDLPLSFSSINSVLVPVFISWPDEFTAFTHEFGMLPGAFRLCCRTPSMAVDLYGKDCSELTYPAPANVLAKTIDINGVTYIAYIVNSGHTILISLDEGDWH